MQWNDSYNEQITCFTNTIKNKDGGTHLTGFRQALTRTVNAYGTETKLLKDLKAGLSGEDLREGLTAVISVKVPGPEVLQPAQGQAGLVRGDRHRRPPWSTRSCRRYLERTPKDARAIIAEGGAGRAGARGGAQGARDGAAQGRARAVEPARQAGRLPGARPGARASSTSSRVSRAGGSAKQGRERKFQAILPLRGKILNVERARFDKMLSSTEIATLITALGCGIGSEKDVAKLRYHRIIIMTDADVDGSHIRTLLLTFFFRQYPELLERGYLYIAQPPLYKVKKGKTELYLKNEEALEEYLIEAVERRA